jgi:hypothetical protein
LPSQALREIDACPGQLLWDILDDRQYARTADALDRADETEEYPEGFLESPMVAVVRDVRAEVDAESGALAYLRQRRAARAAEDADD